MPAYIIVEVHIHNEVEYEDYKKLTPGISPSFQGQVYCAWWGDRIFGGDLATQTNCCVGISNKRGRKGLVGIK
jgi:uncharacterized protein (DUF1330 family)